MVSSPHFSNEALHCFLNAKPKIKSFALAGKEFRVENKLIRMIDYATSLNLSGSFKYSSVDVRYSVTGEKQVKCNFDKSYSGVLEVALFSTLAQLCPLLRELRLFSFDHLPEGLLCDFISKCPLLESVFLDRMQSLTVATLAALAEHSHNLHTLTLRNAICSGVKDHNVIELLTEKPHFKSLSLNKCNNISDKTLHYIANNCVNIRKLHITENKRIKDDGMVNVLCKCTKLRDLSVCGCSKLTCALLFCIAKFCKSLRTLNIRETVRISNKEEVAKFELNYPDLNCGEFYHD